MYLVIRCPGCHTFSYVDRFQQWKLCPICSTSIEVGKATAYLEVEDYRTAERIVRKLEQHLHKMRKSDLTPEEVEQLRAQYADWLRKQAS